jgi:hypothetical protein
MNNVSIFLLHHLLHFLYSFRLNKRHFRWDSTPGDTQSVQPTAGIPGFGRKERWAVLQYHIWRVSTPAEIEAVADALPKEQLLAFLAVRPGRT